ncbi:P-loop containing nucleoside triphosphate hydrolase protein [Microdochium bolleyi]|uniref:p-loop containing nucleoside triphosphate hydrolase protein n=1 Tax=Microdochium bolleyi TaxID=196109 RepID=A0A136JEM7_9PEZI|nr:P-loop containing nucleoside triphosphate hydrolase protein [Microdochium bolleyi]
MDEADTTSRDVASFDLSSTHRMPTISAAQALDDLGSGRSQSISTGITALDQALTPLPATPGACHEPALSGLATGQVAEIWGPPGSGKTALALQLAANALRAGQRVIWADGFHPVSGQRLNAVFEAATSDARPSHDATNLAAGLDNLQHFTTPSLAHLIALLCKPNATVIPRGTSLVVVDSFSALVNHAYPKNVEAKKPLRGPSASSKRAQVIQFIISSLQKLAAAKDLLVVIVSQCATRMQSDRGATITPAVASTALDSALGTRLVLFKDWIGHRETLQSLNLIGIQKANGATFPGVISQVFPFEITVNGVANTQKGLDSDPDDPSSVAYHKRKLDDTGFEVANSEDEAYGWDSDDEAQLPRMPPQAQGSEDLLLGEEDNHESGVSESDLSSPPESDDGHIE